MSCFLVCVYVWFFWHLRSFTLFHFKIPITFYSILSPEFFFNILILLLFVSFWDKFCGQDGLKLDILLLEPPNVGITYVFYNTQFAKRNNDIKNFFQSDSNFLFLLHHLIVVTLFTLYSGLLLNQLYFLKNMFLDQLNFILRLAVLTKDIIILYSISFTNIFWH